MTSEQIAALRKWRQGADGHREQAVRRSSPDPDGEPDQAVAEWEAHLKALDEIIDKAERENAGA